MKRRYKPNVFRDIYEQPYSDAGVTRMKLYKSSKNSLGMVQRLDLLKRLPVHNGCVNSISWNETGDYILSGSDDQHIVISHGFSHKVLTKFKTSHRANIFSAKFLPGQGDRHIVSCSGDGIILFTDLNRPQSSISNQFSCHQGTTYDVVTVPNDSHSFLSCGEDGTVRWFDLRVKDKCRKSSCKDDIMITCHRAVTSLSLNPTAPYQLAVGCSDSRVRLFDRRMLGTVAAGCGETARTCRPLCTFTVPALKERSCRITSLNYSPDGEEILVSFSSDLLYLFSLRDRASSDIAAAEDCDVDGPSSERSPAPVRRLRLRGDWSDTGPHARPERDGGSRGSGEFVETRRTLHSSLMQRMTDVLSRMLNDPATRANLNGGRLPPPPPVQSEDSPESPPRSPVFPFEHPLNDSFSVNPFLPLDSPRSPDPAPPPEDEWVPSPAVELPAEESCDSHTSQDNATSPLAEDDTQNTTSSLENTLPTQNPLQTTHLCTCDPPSTSSVLQTDLPCTSDTLPTPSGLQTNLPCTCGPSSTTNPLPSLSDPRTYPSLSDSRTSPSLSDPRTYPSLSDPRTSPSLSDPRTSPARDVSPSHTLSASADDLDRTMPLNSLNVAQDSLPPEGPKTVREDLGTDYSSSSSVIELVTSVEEGTEPEESQPELEESQASPQELEESRPELEESQASPQELDGSRPECSVCDGSRSPSPEPCNSQSTSDAPRFTIGDPQAKMQLVDPLLDENFARDSPLSPPMVTTESVAVQVTERPVSEDDSSELSEQDEEMESDSSGDQDTGGQQFPRVMYPRPRQVMIPPGDLAQLRNNEDLIDTLHSMRHRHATEPAVLLSVSDVTESGASFAVRLATETDRGPPDIPFLPQNVREREELAARLQGRSRDQDDAPSDNDDDDNEAEREDSAPNFRVIHPIEREMDEAIAGARLAGVPSEDRSSFQPSVRQVFSGHRNARTMIKEACFWGSDYVMSGSDCGHVFVWERSSGQLVQLFEGDDHVVNCLQPHPTLPILATSGIDYDVKLWAPLAADTTFDVALADMLKKRNEIMLEETKDTITVPATFMIRMLACLNQIRRGGRRNRRPEDEPTD